MFDDDAPGVPHTAKKAQKSVQQSQKDGVDLSLAHKFETDLQTVRSEVNNWSGELQHSSRDMLYEVIQNLVKFLYKLNQDFDAAAALYLAKGVDLKKDYSNKFIPFIALTMGEHVNKVKHYKEHNYVEINPGDYRFANVIRYLVDERVPEDEVAAYLHEHSIAKIVKDDKARYTDRNAHIRKMNERKQKLKETPLLHSFPGSDFVKGFHELVCWVDGGGTVHVFGSKPVPEGKEQEFEDRCVSYALNKWGDREQDDDGNITPSKNDTQVDAKPEEGEEVELSALRKLVAHVSGDVEKEPESDIEIQTVS